MPRLWLEGGGGCSGEESYEIAAYFYSRHTDLINCDLPFFFITGDELMYEDIQQEAITKLMGQKEFEDDQLFAV